MGDVRMLPPPLVFAYVWSRDPIDWIFSPHRNSYQMPESSGSSRPAQRLMKQRRIRGLLQGSSPPKVSSPTLGGTIERAYEARHLTVGVQERKVVEVVHLDRAKHQPLGLDQHI